MIAGVRDFVARAIAFDRSNALEGLQRGCVSACAALLAYVPAHALHVREGFWGAITAIGVVQNEFALARSVARDQCVGAAIGGIIGGLVATTIGTNLVCYLGAVIFSVLLCSLTNVMSAARLSAVTATIILLVPRIGSAEEMVAARLAEVAWGVCVAIVVTGISAKLGWSTRRSAQASAVDKASAVDNAPPIDNAPPTESPTGDGPRSR